MSDENKLVIFDHLDELRGRIIISIVTLLIGFAVCFYYSDHLLAILRLPLENKITLSLKSPFISFIKGEQLSGLYFISPAEAFWAHLKIAMIFSILFSFPVIISQVWLFIKPALFKEEKRFAFPLVLFSVILFLLGIAFCSFVVLPFAINFLLSYKTKGLIPMLTLDRYIDFTLKFILAFGIIFETPIVILILTKLNILTPDMLSRNRKYAVLIIFIVAAVLTPTPDVFNQCIMALPLMFLYEVSIVIAKMMYKSGSEEKSGPPAS